MQLTVTDMLFPSYADQPSSTSNPARWPTMTTTTAIYGRQTK